MAQQCPSPSDCDSVCTSLDIPTESGSLPFHSQDKHLLLIVYRVPSHTTVDSSSAVRASLGRATELSSQKLTRNCGVATQLSFSSSQSQASVKSTVTRLQSTVTQTSELPPLPSL
eukprot:g81036.t1